MTATTPAAPDVAAGRPVGDALRLRGVTRRFGGIVAVREVDLDLPRGARRALLGPNGAGKTTLFNLIAGDLPPTAGTIELFGVDVTREAGRLRVRRGLTRTYQRSKLFPGLTVAQNLHLAATGAAGRRYALARSRDDQHRRRDRIDALAASVGLADRLGQHVGSLSHGQQRQLEIAVALAGDPQLLTLDEPAAGLSPAERGMLTDLLLSLPSDLTVLLIEHDMDVALTVADSVTLMHDGRVVVEGSPDEIRGSQLVHDLYLGAGHA